MNDELEKRVEVVRQWVKVLDDRKNRARIKLESYGENESYFIVMNAKIQARSEISDKGYIDVLDNRVFDTGMFSSFGETKAAITLLPFSPSMWTQIVIYNEKFKNKQEIEAYVRKYVSLLSIITSNEMLLLCYSDRAFDTLDAYEDKMGSLEIIDASSKIYNFYKNEITRDELSLASEKIDIFNVMLNEKSFMVSVEAFFSSHHTVIPRLMLANVWLGIEGLIGINSELVFRLSLITSFFLKDDGESRKDLYKHVKSLYTIRSKAVHGSEISDQKILECYINSRNILRMLIIKCLLISKVPNSSEFEDYIFQAVPSSETVVT